MSGGMFNWTEDITGVLKNHFISDKLLEVAIANMVCVPFTTKIDAFGKGAGETVNIYNVKPLDEPTSAELDEFTRIPIDEMEFGTRAITVKEIGRGVKFTNLMKVLSKFDPEAPVQKRLRQQMEGVLDTAAAGAFRGSDVLCKYVPTSMSGGTMYTNGTPVSTATFNVTVDHMGVLRDYLASTLLAPPYQGRYWFGLFSTKALRGIKDDTRMQHWSMYLGDEDLFYNSEVGEVENIRIIEVIRAAAFPASAGASTVLGQACVFGDEAVARVEAEAPEIRVVPNYGQDGGRFYAAFWVGIMKFATWWATATAGEAKVIHITSGSS